MKAKDIVFVIKKNEEEGTYRGFQYYKGYPIASLIGEKRGQKVLEVFIEGKEVEQETYIDKQTGEERIKDKPDLTIFLNVTNNGNVSGGADYVSDFGLFFPVQGWINQALGSLRLVQNTNEKSIKFFTERFTDPITDVPEVEFDEEELAKSFEVFEGSKEFFELYGKGTDEKLKELRDANKARILPVKNAAKPPAKAVNRQIQLNEERPF